MLIDWLIVKSYKQKILLHFWVSNNLWTSEMHLRAYFSDTGAGGLRTAWLSASVCLM